MRVGRLCSNNSRFFITAFEQANVIINYTRKENQDCAEHATLQRKREEKIRKG